MHDCSRMCDGEDLQKFREVSRSANAIPGMGFFSLSLPVAQEPLKGTCRDVIFTSYMIERTAWWQCST